MNVAVKGHLRRQHPQVRFFVPPNPADGGIALGAALEIAARYGAKRVAITTPQFLGSDWVTSEAEGALASHRLDVRRSAAPADDIAALLATGKVVGIVQGRSESGPRALGNRSVLAHPGLPGMRERINLMMKQREPFMPFAPAILKDQVVNWFIESDESPYMMFTYRVRPERAAEIGAVLHRDGTARLQTVSASDNPLLHAILTAFERRTGLPMLLNTSFNLHGLPIIETPADAVEHLRWGCVDSLATGNLLASLPMG
jgi:carbamoyltransferase